MREPDEYDEAHVPGAVLIPLGEVQRAGRRASASRAHLPDLSTGARSRRAAEFLETQGIDAINVVGGTMAWIDAGFPVDQGGAG